MQPGGKFAKLLVIIVSIIVLTSIVFSIFFFSDNGEDVKEISLEEAQKYISLDERSNGIKATDIRITVSSGNFARGKLVDSESGTEKDFYLIKIGEIWRVVEITDKPVSCERFARIGFPNIFIQDCVLTFSDAVTISEIDATLDDFFKSSNNTNLKIIATVESVENTEQGQVVTIDSGGEKIKITLSSEDPSVKTGDLIVTTITAPNSKSTTYTASNSVVVNEQDRDLFEETDTTNPNPVTNTNTLQNVESNKIYKINAPKTYAPPSYFFNVYDVDNSFVDVELEGSF